MSNLPFSALDFCPFPFEEIGLSIFFFFSSRGRHTRYWRDWSSDVCSSDLRIENYLGFPAGITGSELTGRAVTQARKFGARPATPYRAVSLEPGEERHVVRLEDGHDIAARAVVLATGAQYRRLPVERLSEYEGLTVFYAAGPPEGRLCAGS